MRLAVELASVGRQPGQRPKSDRIARDLDIMKWRREILRILPPEPTLDITIVGLVTAAKTRESLREIVYRAKSDSKRP